MDVFRLREQVTRDYGDYIRSFVNIRDPRVSQLVDDALNRGHLWPDPLVQLNPLFEPGETLEELVAEGLLHRECLKIFRRKPGPGIDEGPLRFHRHQVDAFRAARRGDNFVLTTGTGSGKSLAYIVPIVDHVLREGSGKGVRALVVYPMNALANSQRGELTKFLCHGYGEKQEPVTFARYTGQESDDERDAIIGRPPDIILTNYAMLELVLTRPRERKLVESARALRFLVLDELHTYRGRQGADVAMLVRRLREASGAKQILHVGTSATLAGKGSWEDQRKQVAFVASRVFGSEVTPRAVIGETLRRSTTRPSGEAMPSREDLRARVLNASSPNTAAAFLTDPLAAWVEVKLGLSEEPGTGRLIRCKPRALRGRDSATALLAADTGLDDAACEKALLNALMTGARLRDDLGWPIFAFRLHQFISKGESVYCSLEPAETRHITLQAQQFVPGSERASLLLPLGFCRECGQEYYVVRRAESSSGTTAFISRALNDQQVDADGEPGYLLLDDGVLWPSEQNEVLQRLPATWLEEKRGALRVKASRRADVPVEFRVSPAGTESPDGVRVLYVKSPFRFCLNCGITYNTRQKSDFGKLASLGSEGRSTATTILTLSSLRHLRGTAVLEPEARKLLSFTDNRQDASLQAGHFNDFVEIGMLRSALYRAAAAAGQEGLRQEHLTHRVFDALALPMRAYAQNPNVEFLHKENTFKALRRVLGYRLYTDLRRGWRITAPNLEQSGLLNIDYLSLVEVCASAPHWEKRHAALAVASPEERAGICRALLDFMRRELAIRVEFLDPSAQDAILQLSNQYLVAPWAVDERERMETWKILFPVARGDIDEDGPFTFLSPRGGFGSFLKAPGTLPSHHGQLLSTDDVQQILQDSLAVLEKAGVVAKVVETDGIPGYQLNASALVWVAEAGTSAFHDPIRVPNAPKAGLRPNRFFVEFYRGENNDLSGVEAREHTAQVPAVERQRREDEFRTGELPVLFCSPTMELGVDIRQLNVVNMRNVPPTPANYAQRSGRAGRSGQPAFVFTYCSAGSGHDQYFFRRPAEMVSGSVSTPRLDVANEDLLRAHTHAIWLSEVRLDLGHSLCDLLDVSGDNPSFALRPHVVAAFADEGARARAAVTARRCLGEALAELLVGDVSPEAWLRDVLQLVDASLLEACRRWIGLYKAALNQHKRQGEVVRDASRDRKDREQADRLMREAKNQLTLLSEGESRIQSDFYSYRYFASEGFLPGYNFPRLPLSAYLPGRFRRADRQDDMLSRPRFLAITEFGPRSLIYHEGARYSINRVILPVEATEGGVTRRATQCESCGYLHPLADEPAPDKCERCGQKIPLPRENYFRMQNVSTRRRDRINSDEEERVRLGYEVRTGVRFASREGIISERRGILTSSDGEPLASITYGAAATIWRINVGWRRRSRKQDLGFNLDVERGYWAKNPEQGADDDPDDPMTSNVRRVIPYVEDRRNCLLVEPSGMLGLETMASLQAALKAAIQIEYQLEDGEVAAEALPGDEDRRLLLFYEAAEGGAGVLRRLVAEPSAMAEVARRALEICHYDPASGADQGHPISSDERCEAACYDCLLSYYNQRDHRRLNRALVPPVLLPWSQGNLVLDAAKAPSSKAEADLLLETTSDPLHRKWIEIVRSRHLTPPSKAACTVEGVRVDFLYENHALAVFVDGPEHDAPEVRKADVLATRTLDESGYTIVRFHHAADWDALFARYPRVFGGGAK